MVNEEARFKICVIGSKAYWGVGGNENPGESFDWLQIWEVPENTKRENVTNLGIGIKVLDRVSGSRDRYLTEKPWDLDIRTKRKYPLVALKLLERLNTRNGLPLS